MGELLGDLELGLHLFDEADVLLFVADDVLKREQMPGGIVLTAWGLKAERRTLPSRSRTS